MKQGIILLLLTLSTALSAAVQIEMKGYDIFGETKPGNGKYASNAAAVTGTLYGSFALSPKLQFTFSEDLDQLFRLSYTKPGTFPVEKMSPLNEKKIPSSNNVEAGLRYSGFGTAGLRFKNMAYFGAIPVYPEYVATTYTPIDSFTYLHGADALTRKSRNIVNASWLLPVGGFSLFADVNYFGLNYKLDQMGANIAAFPPTDTVFSTFSDSYTELWSRLDLGYEFSKAFGIRAGAQTKSDLSGHPDYNLYRYSVELDGVREFPEFNRFTWSIAGRWYENEIMRSNNFAVGPGGTVYLRDVWSITTDFFLKGLIAMEVGRNLFKERLEVALRKAWDNESYLESGYFANQGGLFPMQGFYVKGKLYVVTPFSVGLNIKSLYEGPDNETYNKLATEKVVSYIKTAGNFEMAWAIVPNFELLGGLDYTYYNAAVFRDVDFPSRGGAYFGVRAWFR